MKIVSYVQNSQRLLKNWLKKFTSIERKSTTLPERLDATLNNNKKESSRMDKPQELLSKSQKRKARKQKKKQKKVFTPFYPLNDSQKFMFDSLQSSTQLFAVGAAGTGKTYISARYAARQLLMGKTEKVIICRPTIGPSGHNLGFLPGSLNTKIRPWLVPLLDAISDDISLSQIDQLMGKGELQFLSFEHMRGRSLNNCIVILDEAQNCTLHDLHMFLTRKGENTQYIINGDPSQCDISNSGLEIVLNLIERYDISADIIEFDENDVVRSKDAKEWVRAFSEIS